QRRLGVGNHLIDAVAAEGRTNEHQPCALRRRWARRLPEDARLGDVQPALGVLAMSSQSVDQAALQGDSGITREQRWIVETLEPALHGLSAATVVDRHRDGRKDACDAARVAARVSVL